MELRDKLENDFGNKLVIVEKSNEQDILKDMLTDLKEHVVKLWVAKYWIQYFDYVQQLGGFSMTILGKNSNPLQRVQWCLKFQTKMVIFSEMTYWVWNLQTR